MESHPGVRRDARSVPVPTVSSVPSVSPALPAPIVPSVSPAPTVPTVPPPVPAAPVQEGGAEGHPRRLTLLRVVLGGAVAGLSRALFDRLLNQLTF
ncbi:hypothetical protein ABZX40_33950 [Streptomyces sp. NPDC004610]|uniref:hypothetical protein n=1 Tax=unclassified Streptomyces TaxID=2593676 RepID=UPI0033A4FECE